MADYCCICDTRRPEGGTKMLVLNGGALWLEFCGRCEDETITNANTGEKLTLRELFDRASQSSPPPDYDAQLLAAFTNN